MPAFHDPAAEVRFAPVNGTSGGPGRLRLGEWSHLRVRLPGDAIGTALPLAGKKLDVTVRRGPARPGDDRRELAGHFKHGEEPDMFLATARTKLAEIGVVGEPAVRAFESGPRAGQPRRQVIRLKGRAIMGYALVVSALTAEELIRLQECGLGGRTKLGRGFFLPHVPRTS